MNTFIKTHLIHKFYESQICFTQQFNSYREKRKFMQTNKFYSITRTVLFYSFFLYETTPKVYKQNSSSFLTQVICCFCEKIKSVFHRFEAGLYDALPRSESCFAMYDEYSVNR